MSEAAVLDAPAPAAAPVAAPAPAPVAASPAPAPAVQSLFTLGAAPAPATEAPAAPAAAPADPFAKVPEKYHVKGADGTIDQAQTIAKLADGYAAAVKRIGTGDLPPADPAKYAFTPPEEFKDVQLDQELTAGFRDRAHKAGLTQGQFEFVMGEYFRLLPSVMDAGAKVSAETARTQLAQVWTTPQQMQTNLDNGQRVMAALPESLQRQVVESGLGANAVFAQVLARMGAEMREDRPPSQSTGTAPSTDVQQLMSQPAYRDPRHPEHAKVSAQVNALMRQRYGDAPVS